jgi:hypothetical protein
VEDIPHPAVPPSVTSSASPRYRRADKVPGGLSRKRLKSSIAAPASMAFGSKFHEPLGELVEAPCAGEISGLGPGGRLRG